MLKQLLLGELCMCCVWSYIVFCSHFHLAVGVCRCSCISVDVYASRLCVSATLSRGVGCYDATFIKNTYVLAVQIKEPSSGVCRTGTRRVCLALDETEIKRDLREGDQGEMQRSPES